MEQTVNDILRPEHVAGAAARWGDHGEPELIGDVENYVYSIRVDGEDRIMRLTHSSHRSVEMVDGELDWIDHLYRSDVGVARPIASRDGALVEVIDAGETYFVASMFERATGVPPRRRDPDVWTTEMIEEWGRTIGRMHAVTKDYVAPAAIKRPEWDQEEMLANRMSYISADDRLLVERLERSIDWMSSLPRDRESYGLVHTDVHQGNFLVDGDRITVFDFDDCCYHWFAYDIAMPLYYMALSYPNTEPDERQRGADEFFPAFMRGYRRENQIADEALAEVERFLKFRDQIMLVFSYKKFDMQNLTEGQERFVTMLRDRVERDLPAVGVGGD